MKKYISNPRLNILLIPFAAIFAAEHILIEIKYGFFSGGFLQSNVLETPHHILSFLGVSLIIDLFLIGLCFFLFNSALRRLGCPSLFICYHFSALLLIFMGLIIGLKYQLQNYFSDAMDLLVIKNIAGGSLKTAMVYVLDEAAIIGISIAVAASIYYFFYRVFKKRFADVSLPYFSLTAKAGAPKRLWLGSAALTVLMGIALLWAQSIGNVRYALTKKVSYGVVNGFFSEISDLDRDGYSWFSYPIDPKPLNASIYPGALDIPNNGIDEDGLQGDFIYEGLLEQNSVTEFGDERKNLIVIVMESTRSDILTKQIDGQKVAPNLREIATEGYSAPFAYSHSGFTGSSIKSLFTGQIYRWQRNASLFKILDEQGYHISIFSGQDETWDNIDNVLGTRKFADKFFDAQVGIDERVFPSKLPSSAKLSEETLFEEFKKMAERADWSIPHFVYFNFQAGHFPYYHSQMRKTFVEEGITRSDINIDNKEYLQKTYWNSMAHADFYIGQIKNLLQKINVWDNTVLVVLGDHGESLFDDNFLGHGHALNDDQTKIPLVFSQPVTGISGPVGLSDLKPIFIRAISGLPSSRHNIIDGSDYVIQYVGYFDNPNRLGMVEMEGRRTILDKKNMRVHSAPLYRWTDYDEARTLPGTNMDLFKLIQTWERIRWEGHLRSQKQSVGVAETSGAN